MKTQSFLEQTFERLSSSNSNNLFIWEYLFDNNEHEEYNENQKIQSKLEKKHINILLIDFCIFVIDFHPNENSKWSDVVISFQWRFKMMLF
jgi:hypothetical protein